MREREGGGGKRDREDRLSPLSSGFLPEDLRGGSQ